MMSELPDGHDTRGEARKRNAWVAAIFGLEAIGCFVLAAVHLGAAVDVPGFVQPSAPVAGVSAACGLALLAAAFMAVTRRRSAWEIGVGVHVAVAAGMLIIDKVLAPADVTPIYRIGMAVAGVVGILLISSVGKTALGRSRHVKSEG